MDTPLTSMDLRVINWIEGFWHRHNRFPLKMDWNKKTKEVPQLLDYSFEEALQNATFRRSLKERGIKVPSTTSGDWGLSQSQIAAIVTVTNFEDTRTRAQKLRELGISTTKWAGWMKDKDFVEFLQEMTATNLKDSLHVANEGLLKAMDRGDTNAIKFYYELTERHGGNVTALQNIRLLLAKILEAVQFHVKDPITLAAIGADFEVILNGGTPEFKQVKEIEV
jgi:hypothetical protein